MSFTLATCYLVALLVPWPSARVQSLGALIPAGIAAEMLEMMWGFSSPRRYSAVPALYLNRQEGDGPVVDTTLGHVRGFYSLTRRDRTSYAAFLGIPYAAPPVGYRRFSDPEDAKPWSGVRDGTYERPTCINFLKSSQGSEDCLYLNVYTPQTTPNVPKAVMAFIHGGAFLAGSCNSSLYSPDFLLDRDVVVAVFNYRLGPLGFLSMQNNAVPGNAGLKDQAMALRWLRDNAASFGGDPKRVTIFGESAGSASVSYHVISRASAGLFDQAIMESGTVLSPWAYTSPEYALRKSYLLGQRVGCTSSVGSDKNAILQCLRSTPVSLLSTAQQESLTLDEMLTLQPFAFLPTTEPDVKGAFLTQTPWRHLTSGDFNKVPVMLGSNSAEGLMVLPVLKRFDPAGVLVTVLGQDLQRLIPQAIRNGMTSGQVSEVSRSMRQFYFDNQAPTMLARRKALDLLTDVQFLWQIQQTALLMAENSSAPVYNYYMTYDGRYGMYKATTSIEEEPGVCHADELGYLFASGDLEERYNKHSDRTRSEEVAIDHMTTLWTNFAKHGTPTPKTDTTLTETWQPFTPEVYHYYEIGRTLSAKQSLQKEHVMFWNRVVNMVSGKSYFNN